MSRSVLAAARPQIRSAWQLTSLNQPCPRLSRARRTAHPAPRSRRRCRPNELNLSRGNVLSVWVACLPENADRANVRATLAGQRLSVVYIEVEVGKPARQINLQVLEGAPVGELPLEVNGSAPVPIQVFR